MWDNGSNWDKELLRGQLAALLGPARAAQLTPVYTADGPVTISGNDTSEVSSQPDTPPSSQVAPEQAEVCTLDADLCSDLLALHREVMAQTGLGSDGRGSNAWVLSGARTTTGKPLLANDPHLSMQIPGFWYLAQLSWPGHDVIGATVPGIPGVQTGHNGSIAWGVTTIIVDAQDIYIEQINERNEALYQGVWEPLQVVPETIKVKGAADVQLQVRISRHGPLISDAVSPGGPALAVRWTGHDPQDDGMFASLAINRARNWDEFTQAFRTHRPSNQNYVYADQAGNIGYIAAGIIPIRANGDGRVPVPGWTGEYEWTGYVPWERLPQTYNPPEGYIVTSNNKVIGDDYPYMISNSYAAPYRAARVIEMLGSQGKLRFSADDMAAMQADVLALHARKLMPLLLRTTPADERSRQALSLLRRWDFRATGDSSAAAVFEAWYIRIAQRLFADELTNEQSDKLWTDYSSNLYFVGMATEAALQEHHEWCDDVQTDVVETCGDTLAVALSDGLADMAAAQGSEDITTWRWNNVHRAQFLHQPLGTNPQAGPLFNRRIPNGGNRFTVNVASSFHAWEDYDQFHAAQYRHIVDFGNLDSSRWIVAPGQSGHPASPHYDDLLQRWQQVEYLPMR